VNEKKLTVELASLASQIKQWGLALGFQQLVIADTDLSEDEAHLVNWLDQNYHGEMKYMQTHGVKRSRPTKLIPGTIRVISVRMDYYPDNIADAEQVLNDSELAFISRYALGRDYHKVLRKRLQKLADLIRQEVGEFGYRAFVDSAPVMEKALASKAGLGWLGKHSNLINPKAGSWFFLGELYTDLPLPIDKPLNKNYYGTCRACIDVCPTQAIIAPYQVDARKCISYLTIELKGSIPEQYRKLVGNRIFGCDDCQLICPWNKFSKTSEEKDFGCRHGLDTVSLTESFSWSEEKFLHKTEGSAIRRVGYECWLRNIAVALGNATTSNKIVNTLDKMKNHNSSLVREHVRWALLQHF